MACGKETPVHSRLRLQYSPMLLSRRHLLALACALPCAFAGRKASAFLLPQTLRGIAQNSGLLFGAALPERVLKNPALSQLYAEECAIITPENAMKWGQIQPSLGVFDFSITDLYLDFCRLNTAQLRGHTLIWHKDANRGWLTETLKAHNAEQLLRDHITTIMTHYAGRLHSIDVVNEAINTKDGRADGLRTNSPWMTALGPQYINLAFESAAQADPTAKLVYNENNLEYDTPKHEARRTALLQLLDQLLKQNTPIHAVGLQSHLVLGQPFAPTILKAFISAIHQRGIEVMITELDVDDSAISGTRPAIDRAVADHAKAYLETVLDAAPVKVIQTWGLQDDQSWMRQTTLRPDGASLRPLPYDRNGEAKRFRAALADILGEAGN